MYIPDFWVGAASVVAFEIVLILIMAIWRIWKK